MSRRQQTIRIIGLVRTASLVRRRLQAGIRPEEAQRFREQVASVIRAVDEICAQNQMTPDLLPVRSRQAYRYLKDLKIAKFPWPIASVVLPAEPSLRIKNVVKGGDNVADLLWQPSDSRPNSATTHQQLKREIQRRADHIEQICDQSKVTPGALATPTRRVYCWFKFLLSEDNLTLHLAVLGRARAMVECSQPPLGRPLRLYLINQDSLWRKNPHGNELVLKINQGFLNSGQEVWEALIRTALYQRDPVNDQRVREFGSSEEFNEILFELESFAAPAATTVQGQFHNLEESFDRVNAVYFQGSMPKPNLVWSQVRTVQTFGHFQPSRDTVMLSLSLDQPMVPPSLVDYLMYHELLHKKHGTTVANGRRLVHTSAFRKDEQGFSGYEAARRQLTELALGLRSRAHR